MTEPWWRTPGVHSEITEAEYHSVRDPRSVTSSMLRKITPPEFTPAHLRHYLDAEREEKSYFDLGSAFHTGVLGTGKTIVEVEQKSWQADAAKAARKAAYANGAVPLLTKEGELVAAMVEATRAHPDCRELFKPGMFTAELVVVWYDEATGLFGRAMLDAVPDYSADMTLIDLKSMAGNASPAAVSTFIARYNTHQQFGHYIAGCRTIGLAERITPVLVACGKDAPHVPLCRPIDDDAIQIGMVCNRKAMDLYATCLASGEWPGYDSPGAGRQPLSLPGWKRYQFQAAFDEGVYDVDDSMELF